MIINFECQKCSGEFNCDVGSVTLSNASDRPQFEKSIICPSCGAITINDVFLTELGQSQLTEATFPSEPDFLDQPHNGPCSACEDYLELNDIGLCDHCGAKLERDTLRQRQWEYSVSAFGLDSAQREDLRKTVIHQYGEKLELISASPKGKKKSKGKRKNR